MQTKRIKIGDYVQIVGLYADGNPTGIVKRKDGAYIYVLVDYPKFKNNKSKLTYETYENELVKITKQEYFKLILSGVNNNL